MRVLQNPSRRSGARTVVPVLTAFVSVFLVAATATAQDRTAAAGQPSPQAEAAGINRAGQAYMAWSDGARAVGTSGSPGPTAVGSVDGMDVSGWQGNVDWFSWWGQGMRFAYVKATESLSYQNPYFTQQYNGSYNVGMLRGAYHFGRPDTSSGAAQANYFVDHGGGWSADGMTLPGVLDIEYNPYGEICFGMSASRLVSWIADFADTYRARTGRDVVIYTARNWWAPCTGDSTAFSQTNPLWAADWNNSRPILFGGWSFHTFHQWTDSPLDQNRFNGSYDRLQALAYE